MNMEDDLDPKHYRKAPLGFLGMALLAIVTLFGFAIANISGVVGMGLLILSIGYVILFCVGMEFTALRLTICLTSAAIGISLCAFHLRFGDGTQPTRKR